MNSDSLTVVIPSYDLEPILGPLGLLPDICKAIRNWAMVLSMADVNTCLGGSQCMYYGFYVMYDPQEAVSRQVRHKYTQGLAVWYDAVMSPEYDMGSYSRSQIEQHSEVLSGPALIARVRYDMIKYISIVSEIMDVNDPPTDFHRAFIQRGFSGTGSFMRRVGMDGGLVDIDSLQGFPIDSIVRSMARWSM